MLYITADHGGWAMKKQVVLWFGRRHVPHIDLCPNAPDPTDDYPLKTVALVRAIKRQRGANGIAICRSGVGMAIAANKYPGIRAVQGWNAAVAKRSRQDENTNIITFAADWQSFDQIKRIIHIWLMTAYRSRQRDDRRLRQIKNAEHAR